VKKLLTCLLFASLPYSSAQAADNPFAGGVFVDMAGWQVAGPPHGKGPPGHARHKARGGGPPPWAPAHGYRRAHAHYREYNLPAPPINMSTGRCNREVMGQILGGAAGGAIGSQIGDGTGRLIAVAAGTVIGMIAGREIGRSMDRADELCVDQALEHANTGETIHWQHDDRRYAVTPRNTYEKPNGQYCREYTTTTSMNDREQSVSGTACRQEDGSWRIVDS